jgi:integrase
MQGIRVSPGEHGVIQFTRKASGRYVARVRFRDLSGAWRSVQATAVTKSAARAAVMASLKNELRTTGSELSGRTTFAVVAGEWFRQIEELVADGRRSAGTLDLYRHVLDRHVLPALGGLRLSELTTARLDRFLRDKRAAKGYATAKLCRSVVSGVCGVAVRRDALRSNPVRDVSNLERRYVKQARALTPEEARAWLRILDESELAQQKDLPDLTRFLLGTGCRLGEALGVRWPDLDLDRHLLHVRRTVIRVKGRGLVAKAPK